jgi:hypothetical protein
MIGARFGRLTVTARAPKIDRYARFRCICDCGALTEVRAASLRAGHVRSCGCLRQRGVEAGAATTKNMTGKRIGRLVVIGRAGSEQIKGDSSLALWSCACSCGSNVTVAGAHLRRGSVKSCGCLRREIGRSKLAAWRAR